jgi:hypothetical protein
MVTMILLLINLNSKCIYAAEKAATNGYGMGLGMGMMGKTTMPAMGGYCLFGDCQQDDEAFLLSKLDQIYIAKYNSFSAFKANLKGFYSEYQMDIKAPFSEEQKKLAGRTLYTTGIPKEGKELDLLVSDIPENAYEYLYAKYLNQLDGQLNVAKNLKEFGNEQWGEELNRNIQHTKEIVKDLESKIQKGKQISSCDSGRLEDGKFVDGKCHTRTTEKWVFENQEKERKVLQETAPINMLSEVEDLSNVYQVNKKSAVVEFARLNTFNKCSSVNFRIYTTKGKKYLYIDNLVLNENGLDTREFKNYWAEAVRNSTKTAALKSKIPTPQTSTAPLTGSNR